jgi:hypothetical protein
MLCYYNIYFYTSILNSIKSHLSLKIKSLTNNHKRIIQNYHDHKTKIILQAISIIDEIIYKKFIFT